MKKSVVIYGNCHTEIISQMLETCKAFNERYYIIPTKRIQNIKDPKELYNDSYRQCDVFIHQSIRLGNRYGEEYASEKIISRLKAGCKVISIPNVYHLPLCFFPQYSDAPELRKDGVTYFFRDSIIDSHLNQPLTLIKRVKKDYNNPNRFDRKAIIDSFELFINKIKKREEDWDIKVSNFILENYRDHQLFYDPNHPTNFFLSYIATELLKLLMDNSSEEEDKLAVDNCLDTIEMPISAAVVDTLRLNWVNDVIRQSNPITNKLQCKMTLNLYVYQYVSSIWISKDCPPKIKPVSRFLWFLTSMVSFAHRACNYMFKNMK